MWLKGMKEGESNKSTVFIPNNGLGSGLFWMHNLSLFYSQIDQISDHNESTSKKKKKKKKKMWNIRIVLTGMKWKKNNYFFLTGNLYWSSLHWASRKWFFFYKGIKHRNLFDQFKYTQSKIKSIDKNKAKITQNYF